MLGASPPQTFGPIIMLNPDTRTPPSICKGSKVYAVGLTYLHNRMATNLWFDTGMTHSAMCTPVESLRLTFSPFKRAYLHLVPALRHFSLLTLLSLGILIPYLSLDFVLSPALLSLKNPQTFIYLILFLVSFWSQWHTFGILTKSFSGLLLFLLFKIC